MLKTIETQIAAWRIRNPHLLEDAETAADAETAT